MSAYAARTGSDVTKNEDYHIGTSFNSQIGYLFDNSFEVAARFTMVRKAINSVLKSNNEYTIGVSKYIVGHALKIQSDISRIETLNRDSECKWKCNSKKRIIFLTVL